MAAFKICRETALPGTPVNDSLYVVAPAGTPNYFELYAVNSTGSVRRIQTDADLTSKINAALGAAFGACEITQISDQDGNGVRDARKIERAMRWASDPSRLVDIANELARYWLYSDAATERDRTLEKLMNVRVVAK